MPRRNPIFRPNLALAARRSPIRRRLACGEHLESRQLLAVFGVTSSGDAGLGSLRTAVAMANLSPGPDTIEFHVAAVQLTQGEIVITDAVDLNGSTAPTGHVTIQAALAARIFRLDDISPAQLPVSMNELTLTGGQPTSDGGGAILNRENLRMMRSTVTGNTASRGGAILNEGARLSLTQVMVQGNSAQYEGGGIMNVNFSQLDAVQSEFRANQVSNSAGASTFGGAIQNLGGSTATLVSSLVLGNSAHASVGPARAHGGGISTMLQSTTLLRNSIVGDNYSSHEGGGLFLVDDSTLRTEYDSSLPNPTVSQVFGNIAGEAGGGIYLLRSVGDLQDTTITGNLTELRGGGISAGNDVQLDITRSKITSNSTNLTLPDGSGGGIYLSGFGLTNGPVTTIVQSDISGNNVNPSGTPGGEFGGGISVRYGTVLNVLDSTITGNKALLSGGGLYVSDRFRTAAPQVTITRSAINQNVAGLGGGLTMAGGMLDVSETTFERNMAEDRGGGLFLTGLGSPAGLQTQIRDSAFRGNRATREGGGIAAGPQLTLNLERSTVSANRTDGKGGGLYLTALGIPSAPHFTSIRDSTISGNFANLDPTLTSYASGGGIWGGPAAHVSVATTTITGNHADRFGGGVMMRDTGPFDIRESTVDSNTAAIDGGGGYFMNSEGLLEQVTWTQNAAENGGGLHLNSVFPRLVTIRHNTFALNQADHDLNGLGTGGGIFVHDDPSNQVQVEIRNTIAADNFRGSILSLPHNNDLYDGPGLIGMTPSTIAFSLVGSEAGTLLVPAHPDANGNIVGSNLAPVDPLLGALANYGGPTLTMELQPGSPAVDSGDPLFGGGPAFDQRGTPWLRVYNGRIDMGAVEQQPATPVYPGPDLDGDGDADCDDINALTASIASQTYVASYDMNLDGVLNHLDLLRWLCKAGSMNLGPGLSYRVGDANLDGVVDGTDFGYWNANRFSVNSQWCAGDFNADGMVDGLDYGLWNANKFQGAIPCNPVPRPGGGSAGPANTCGVVASPASTAVEHGASVKTAAAGDPVPWSPSTRKSSMEDSRPRRIHRIVDLIFADVEAESR